MNLRPRRDWNMVLARIRSNIFRVTVQAAISFYQRHDIWKAIDMPLHQATILIGITIACKKSIERINT